MGKSLVWGVMGVSAISGGSSHGGASVAPVKTVMVRHK